MTDLTLQIEAEIAKAQKLKPGYTGSDLSGIINSYGDTMDDAWVLEQMRKWNARHGARAMEAEGLSAFVRGFEPTLEPDHFDTTQKD